MRRINTLLFAVLLPMAASAQSVGNIVINKTDNTTETYKMEDVGKMSYTTTELQLFLNNDLEKPASTINIGDITSINVQNNDYQAIPKIVDPQSNSRWFDFQRLFWKSEVMAGNLYEPNSPFLTLTVNEDNENLINGIGSLNGYVRNEGAKRFCPPSDSIMRRLNNLTNVDPDALKAAKGELMMWEALAMFYQVRLFGAVPITNDPAGVVEDFDKVRNSRVAVSFLYEYVIKTLERAIELLPERNIGGIDKYSAKGLLAKVYLTRSGFREDLTKYNGHVLVCQQHERNAEDLQKAAELALDVIKNSGRKLMPVYSDILLGKNNVNEEALISWRWKADNRFWSFQNTMQCDFGMNGFSDFGDCWGDGAGPSVDLQDAFGEDALSPTRTSKDARRKATMMMMGDTYDYFYTDLGGFDYTKFINNGYADQGHQSYGFQASRTKANVAKHLYGTAYDHEQAGLGAPSRMVYGLYTHLLRLADVYLIYCEAVMGNQQQTTDEQALECFYQVRHRGVADYEKPTVISWEDVWKERRLELALEGDRWGDLVRLYYYNPEKAINEIKSQRRNGYSDGSYDTYTPAPDVNESSFTLPYPANSTFSEAATATPMAINIIDSDMKIPQSVVTVNETTPLPARFGEPLTITGNNLDKVEWVSIPNVGRLQDNEFTATNNTLTIHALPMKSHNGNIELGTGEQYPLFVNYKVAEMVVESNNPETMVGGEIGTFHGQNLQWVESISFWTMESNILPQNYGVINKSEFIKQAENEIQVLIPAALQLWGGQLTATFKYCNDINYSVHANAVHGVQPVILKAETTVKGGDTYSIAGLNLDQVKRLMIGNVEMKIEEIIADADNIIKTIRFTASEGIETGKANYMLELKDGTIVTGPEVNTISTKVEILQADAQVTPGKAGYRITGQNLGKVKRVLIGNTEMMMISANEQQLVFSVPNEAETGTFNYILELQDGTTITGPEVNVVMSNETMIWSGEIELNWDSYWNIGDGTAGADNPQIFADAGLKEGMTIHLYIDIQDKSWSIMFMDGHWNGQTEIGNALGIGENQIIDGNSLPLAELNGCIDIPVTAKLAEQLTTLTDWGYCWVITGSGCKITKITIE